MAKKKRCDPKFKKRLDKAKRILYRELKDGCLSCREEDWQLGFCPDHIGIISKAENDPKNCKELLEILGIKGGTCPAE